MFNIYDRTQGVTFDGSMEDLFVHLKVHKIFPPKKISFSDAIDLSIQDLPKKSISNKVINAYLEVLPSNKPREKIFHAKDIMATSVHVLQSDVKIINAWKFLRKNQLQHVPVMEKKSNLVGIFSKSDLLNNIDIEGEKIIAPENVSVADIMSKKFITASPLTDIRRIAKVMVEYDINSIPIVNDYEKLVGLISKTNILNALVKFPPLQLWG